MRKVSLLLAFAVAGLTSFAQYNTPSVDIQKAELLKSSGKIINSKQHTQVPNRAPGDVLFNFDFTGGIPTGWTSVSDNPNMAGWVSHTGLVDDAAYVTPAYATINSTSGGEFMNMPVEYYNTQPGSCPACADNAVLEDCDATLTTDWMDVTGIPNVVLTYNSWFRYWGSGAKFEIYVYVNGDDVTPAATLDGHNINGTVTPQNSRPGAAKDWSTTTPGDGYNCVFPQYNLTAAVGSATTITQVKIAFRVSGTSHYGWCMDDVQIIEPQLNDLSLVDIYACNFGLYTLDDTYDDGSAGIYEDYNTNYAEVPSKLINQLQLGGKIHQKGVNGENTRMTFAMDSAGTSDVWTGISTTIIPDFGLVTLGDTILHTDTLLGDGDYTREFYNPELDLAFFEDNDFYENGIPYVFKYTLVSDNADFSTNDDFEIYNYAQTWGRYSYHQQPTDTAETNVWDFLTIGQYSLAAASGDMFTANFECYQADDVDAADEFKIYGIRFFLSDDDTYSTFDASGNGVEVKPILYTYDATLDDYVEFEDAFAATTVLTADMAGTWVYLPFDNDGGDIDAAVFDDGNYRAGVYVEDYHNEMFAIGVDRLARQCDGHSLSYVTSTWYRLGLEGSIMIDMYTNIEQFNYDMSVGVKEVSKKVTDNVKVYPNPTTGLVNIVNAENATINIYSIAGNLVKTIQSNAVRTSVDLSGFAKGTYLVKIVKENEVVTKKINLLK